MKHVLKKLSVSIGCMIALAQVNQLHAQTTANTTLNVVLADVQSIKVNPAQTNVSLVFNNAADYNNGVSSPQTSHLEVTSTRGFAIKVKSSGPNLVNGTNTIPVNTITLTPSKSSTQPVAAAGSVISIGGSSNSFYTTTLNPTAANLVTSATGNIKIYYDVKYQASGGSSYINKAAGTYTTTITYSIEPL